ncbi:hypothetical protein RI367_006983 [Sorochytrium milnesiophthora]
MSLATITSTKNDLIRHLTKLTVSRRHRDSCRELVIFGRNAVRDVLHQPPIYVKLKHLIVPTGSDAPVVAGSQDYRVVETSPTVIKTLANLSSSTVDIAAHLSFPSFISGDSQSLRAWLSSHTTPSQSVNVLVVNGVRDPGNLGSLFRLAFGFGWQAVLVVDGSVDPFNDKALRSAKAISWSELLELVADDDGVQLLVADTPEAVARNSLLPHCSRLSKHISIHSAAALPPSAAATRLRMLVLSSEAHGPRTVAALDTLPHITIDTHHALDSLNVSMAGAILMWQLKEQT